MQAVLTLLDQFAPVRVANVQVTVEPCQELLFFRKEKLPLKQFA